MESQSSNDVPFHSRDTETKLIYICEDLTLSFEFKLISCFSSVVLQPTKDLLVAFPGTSQTHYKTNLALSRALLPEQ